MQTVRGIIFDFDGTLANSFIDGMASWEHALASVGHRMLHHDEVRQYFGAGADRILSKIVKDESRALKAFAAYTEYQRKNAIRVKWHDEVEELLHLIAEHEVPTGIVTGRHSTDLFIVGEQLRLEGLFPAIVCDDHLTESKPSPQGILLAAQKLGLKPAEVFYVGDSSGDIKAARAAGAIGIAALWDPITTRQAFELEPDYWAESPLEVWRLFQKHQNTR